jgi:hypothetical protein
MARKSPGTWFMNNNHFLVLVLVRVTHVNTSVFTFSEIKKRKEITMNTHKPTIESLIENVSLENLKAFIIEQAKVNKEINQAVYLNFLQQVSSNNYAILSAIGLNEIDFDLENMYHVDCIDLDILDDWFSKAKIHVAKGEFDVATAICKAYIEEFAEWHERLDEEQTYYISEYYFEQPFELLTEIGVKLTDNKSLYLYCQQEMQNPKYHNTIMFIGFNDLLLSLVQNEDTARDFLVLQDELLAQVSVENPLELQGILESKIALYNKINQPVKAWEIISDNIQFEKFRKLVIEQKIADKAFSEAKKLITDFIESNSGKHNFYLDRWNEFLLIIAQEEKDVSEIRKLSFGFIQDHFQINYYRVYKATYSAAEWQEKLTSIIAFYENKNQYYAFAVSEILVEEKDASQLLAYISKYPSIDIVEKYYPHFVKTYPQETLDLFKKALDYYANKNTGRHIYENMARIFPKIALIENGKPFALNMIAAYRSQYKSRRAMVEVFNAIKL